MKIWQLEADANHVSNFSVVNEQDFDVLIEHFDGRPMVSEWTPIRLKIREKIEEGDMQPLFGGIPVFSRRAVIILKEFLDGNVELLKLDYDESEYFAVNVLRIIDCIDYQKAVVEKFDDGSIMRFEKYAFRIEEVQDKHIFKNVTEKKGFALVSDAFRDRVIQNNLKGFLFTELWDADDS